MDKSKLFEVPGEATLFAPVEEVQEKEVVEQVEEVLEEEEETPTPEDDKVEEVPPVEKTGEEEEVVEEEETPEKPNEDTLQARKDLALFASDIFKEDGYELFSEEELEGDITILDVGSKYKERLREDLTPIVQQEILEDFERKGYNEETLQYAKLIQSGVDVNLVSDINRYDVLSKLKDDIAEDTKLKVIKEDLIEKGTSERNIARIMEGIEVNETLDEDFKDARQSFKKRRDELFETKTREAQEAEQHQEKLRQDNLKRVEKILTSGEVKSTKLDKSQVGTLRKSLFEKTVDFKHENKVHKITPFQEFLYNLNNDVEFQLEVFSRVIFKDGIEKKIVNKGLQEHEKKLMKFLDKTAEQSTPPLKEKGQEEKPAEKIFKKRLFEI